MAYASGTNLPPNSNANITLSAGGTYIATVTAYNADRSRSVSATATLPTAGSPRFLSAAWSPATVDIGQPATLSWTVTDAVSVAFSIPGGQPSSGVANSSVVVTFPQEGIGRAVLTATGVPGSTPATTFANVTIAPPPPPVIMGSFTTTSLDSVNNQQRVILDIGNRGNPTGNYTYTVTGAPFTPQGAPGSGTFAIPVGATSATLNLPSYHSGYTLTATVTNNPLVPFSQSISIPARINPVPDILNLRLLGVLSVTGTDQLYDLGGDTLLIIVLCVGAGGQGGGSSDPGEVSGGGGGAGGWITNAYTIAGRSLNTNQAGGRKAMYDLTPIPGYSNRYYKPPDRGEQAVVQADSRTYTSVGSTVEAKTSTGTAQFVFGGSSLISAARGGDGASGSESRGPGRQGTGGTYTGSSYDYAGKGATSPDIVYAGIPGFGIGPTSSPSPQGAPGLINNQFVPTDRSGAAYGPGAGGGGRNSGSSSNYPGAPGAVYIWRFGA